MKKMERGRERLQGGGRLVKPEDPASHFPPGHLREALDPGPSASSSTHRNYVIYRIAIGKTGNSDCNAFSVHSLLIYLFLHNCFYSKYTKDKRF